MNVTFRAKGSIARLGFLSARLLIADVAPCAAPAISKYASRFGYAAAMDNPGRPIGILTMPWQPVKESALPPAAYGRINFACWGLMLLVGSLAWTTIINLL